jgi:hypothetical protein
MKRAFALTLLLMSFVSVAFADGSGLPPATTTKPEKPGVVLLADGSGLPPVAQKAPKPEIAA